MLPSQKGAALNLSSWRWRCEHLYSVINEKGKWEPFKPNAAQDMFMENMHGFDLILKARQLGMSTAIQIMLLDCALFHPTTGAGVIAQDRDTANEIFRTKFKDVYDRLPEGLKNAVPAKQDKADQMVFGNGSVVRVGTSLRGGTFQVVHISELGKISAKYPDKAREIKSGTLNTVHAGQHLFIESTAEGQGGLFYELCQEAMERQRRGDKPRPLEFKLHFFPWFDDPKYMLPAVRTIPRHHQEYFDALKRVHSIELSATQKSWYSQKANQQREDMKREFPSTPQEAFEAAIEGAYFAKEMSRAIEQRRIGDYPYDPRLGPVFSFWDLGTGDGCGIWLGQRTGPGRWRFFKYFEAIGEQLPYYAKEFNEIEETTRCDFGAHVLPHDGDRNLLEGNRLENFERNGFWPLEVVPRTKDVMIDIPHVRDFIEVCEFDRQGCADGLKHLQNYRPDWDDHLGVWKNKPRHDEASRGADAFRTAAMCSQLGMLDEQYYEDTLPEQKRGNSITGY